MIYIIDHKDSFTHNVVHQFENFDDVTCDNYNEINNDKLNKSKVIVFSPGPGAPKDYPISSDIYKKFKGKKKIIGICAGFQVLCQQIEENGKKAQGLNLIPAISSDRLLPIYNNGWGATCILNDIPNSISIRKNVYFNHSCGVFPQNNSHAFDLNEKGFAISYLTENIVGLQFHPEKSGAFGIELGKYIFDV